VTGMRPAPSAQLLAEPSRLASARERDCARSVRAGARDRFACLDVGLAVILVFIGARFMLTALLHIGVGVSLVVTASVLGVAIGASLLRDRSKVA
jgi:predicted tellurium resistance membrane protein TerC